MITRAARALVYSSPLAAPLQRAFEQLRRRALLSENILSYGLLSFDRRAWVIKETGFGVRLWCSLDELAISRPILVNAYEPAETKFIATAVKRGDLAVDAGANIGYHALHAAKLVGEGGFVEAFEPLTAIGDALEASIAENGFAARMNVRRMALDERPGTLRLRHAPAHDQLRGRLSRTRWHAAPGSYRRDRNGRPSRRRPSAIGCAVS